MALTDGCFILITHAPYPHPPPHAAALRLSLLPPLLMLQRAYTVYRALALRPAEMPVPPAALLCA